MHHRLFADLGSGRTEPMHQRLYDGIRAAVLDGRLPPGTRLPSARALAAQLAIARGTVDVAYQRLAGEGFVTARGAAGTCIAPDLDPRLFRGRPAVETGERARPESVPPAAPKCFQMGLPALDAFPHKRWARLGARHARATRAADLAYPPPGGHGGLREQLSRYLAVSRGIQCRPGQIVITAGFQGALGLIAHALLRAGDTVWVEDPGYPRGRDALRLAGVQTVGIPVDADGFDVDHARAHAPPATLALVTPTHQFPLGHPLSLKRRGALLDWAVNSGGWVVEDDYDSEYRYRGRPLPALKSLDRHDRVLYAGTFSKVLTPALRIGYLVLPSSLAGRFAEAANLLQPPPAPALQATVAEFLACGDFARHVRRMRALYGQRRAALADALHTHLPARVSVEPPHGGMHLLLRLPAGIDDVDLAHRLADAGMAPTPLSTCAVAAPHRPGLLLGFTNVPVEAADGAARALAAALRRFGV